ncbi:MAG: DUF1853 family protein [Alcanivoracaceae bacterium]|nr:DUF1853 family protein [Alcanivoracaceae bacterium]
MHKDNDGLSVADVGAMLDWLQHGPPLLQPPPGVGLFDELLVARPKLEQLAPDVHRRYLSQADQRLGKLFELLCRALIEQQPHLSILAHNLVMQKQRTLGELDLVLADCRDNSVCHVELTLKFYLGIAGNHWPGPNPDDSLERKWQHLAEHQFPLPRRADVVPLLQQAGIARIDRQYLFSRGQLFYPGAAHLQPPAQAHPDHLRGRWWRASDLPADNHWQLVPRHHWLLAGRLLDNGSHHLASTEVFDYVHQRKRPQMVIRHGFDGSRENTFIVPDQGWPNDAG